MLQYCLSFSWMDGPSLCNMTFMMIWMVVSSIWFIPYILSISCSGLFIFTLNLVQYRGWAGWNPLLYGNWCAFLSPQESLLYFPNPLVVCDHKGHDSRTDVFNG
jgi:hypothetical protein